MSPTLRIFVDTAGWLALANKSDILIENPSIMEEQRVQEAFTADRHFQQAGYNSLLKAK